MTSLRTTFENEFLLKDRIQKIRSMDKFDLRGKSYLSFSGGKDSVAVHYLLDMALPGNRIPRVYFDTGIEYNLMRKFVQQTAEKDDRIKIIRSGVNIPEMLREYGYPFKSKEHSQKVALYQHSGMKNTVREYLGEGEKTHFLCPKIMRYNFTEDFHLKVSDKCCTFLKKNVALRYEEESGKTIAMTGIRQGEQGLRQSMRGCAVFRDAEGTDLKKFHPLFPCDEEFVRWFIESNGIRLCELYYPPYSFKRTGCKGCPYSLDLQRQLEIMSEHLPAERRQCELIWGQVYNEYRRIGYRLESNLFSM